MLCFLKSAFSGDFGKHKNRKAHPFREEDDKLLKDYMINSVSESDFTPSTQCFHLLMRHLVRL